ncbi:hypothetical protein GCM10009127_21630 [Alteraurantiacibacter aestuarii]|uniref:hypothetical protein n=1 Tax=Alteraurantiacibacter aestuarii TaxID=650004 RepID=UPI0031E23F83
MDSRPPLTLAEQYVAACDWWREAGVDQDFNDVAEPFLQEPEQQAEKVAAPALKAAEPELPKVGGARESWPTTLEDFAGWWMNEPSLDEAPAESRVAPRGAANADVMVIVPMPEADDSDTLLAGHHGKLIANMLRAMEVPADKAYFASALPRHMPLAGWDDLHAAGHGEVLLHHIALCAPVRVIVLGRDILTVLGQEKRQGVCEIALPAGSIHVLASFEAENLIANARLRADLWRRWLDWTGKA